MLAPREALENLRRLAQEGAEGPYGFYEALDYTPERVPMGERCVVVKSFMAHHQGMSLVALANTLLADVMPRRFHAEPMVRAMDLLLQERVPNDPPIVQTPEARLPAEGADKESAADSVAPMSRRLTSPDTPVPRTNLFSNSAYHVMITNAGSGYSKCQGLDVTRWREDPTCETWGQFCYIRDVQRDLVWSAGYQPVCRPPEGYEVIFAADKATIRRRDADIETLLEVTVSPEQPVEVRRITLTNHDSRQRELEITSYVEIVLAPHGDDLAHPAFGKLFLETEWIPGTGCLVMLAPASIRPGTAGLCHARRGRGHHGGRGARSWAVPSTRPIALASWAAAAPSANPAALDHGVDALGHDRPGPRPGSLPAPSRPAQARGIGRDCAGHGRRRLAIRGSCAGRSVSPGQRRLAGVRAGVGPQPGRAPAQRSISARVPTCFSAWARTSFSPDRRCGPTVRCSPPTAWDKKALWRFGISGDRPIVLARFQNADQTPAGARTASPLRHTSAPRASSSTSCC